MRAVAECCGEEVAVAAFAQLEPLPEFCNGRWEIADGQIALSDAFQHPFQVLLGKAARVLYQERASRKIPDEMGRSEQVAEGMQLTYIVCLAERVLYAGLHNGSIRLVEEGERVKR